VTDEFPEPEELPEEATPEPAAETPEPSADDESAGDELTLARMELAEMTADLQRLQAEYLNYKRRVDRDRELIRQNATYSALTPIVEVLDTIDRAREHGPLEGGFKAVADQLERVVAGFGMSKFGEVGEPFDPNVHEALSHIGEDPEVEVTTCKVIAKAGYRIGDRVVRAAQVLVVDPVSAGPAPQPPTEPPAAPADEPAEPTEDPPEE
jgi:molecular chaperone GrpE